MVGKVIGTVLGGTHRTPPDASWKRVWGRFFVLDGSPADEFTARLVKLQKETLKHEIAFIVMSDRLKVGSKLMDPTRSLDI